MGAYDYSLATEEALWEQFTRNDTKRQSYQNSATPDLALAIDDIVSMAPNLTADLAVPFAQAVVNGQMTLQDAARSAIETQRVPIETNQPAEDNRNWWERTRDAAYEALKTGTRWTFAAAEFIPQSVQNLAARGLGPTTGRFGSTDAYRGSDQGFFDGFIASTDFGTLLTGVEAGNGFFIGEAAAEQQRQKAKEYRGTIGEEGWTLGRGFALSFSQPGSRAYNIASGLVDAVAAIGTPSIPFAKPLKAGATGAGNLLGLRSAAGLTNFSSAHINPAKVSSWLDSRAGNQVINRIAKINTLEEAMELFPKTDGKFWHDIVDKDMNSFDKVKKLLKDNLGLERGLQSTEDLSIGRMAALRRGTIKRVGLSRLAAPVPGRELIIASDDVRDITATMRNARDYMKTAGVKADRRNEVLKQMSDALFDQDGLPKARTALDALDSAMVETLARKSKNPLRRNMDEDFLNTVFQRYRDDIREFDLYGDVDNNGDMIRQAGFEFDDDGVIRVGRVDEATAHLSTEMKKWGYFMPDPRNVRRTASKYSWLFTKTPSGDYKWGDPRGLISLMDTIQNSIWRPMTLLTGGYIFRNMLESTVRQTMTPGIKTGFTHPLEWIQTVMYKRFAGDINGDEWIDEATKLAKRGQRDYAEANNSVMRESLDPLRMEESAYRNGYYSLARKRAGDPARSSEDYVRGVANELRLLAGDDLAREIASNKYVRAVDVKAEAELTRLLGPFEETRPQTVADWLKTTEDGKKYLREAQARWTNKRMVDENGQEFVGSVNFIDESDPANIKFNDNNINRLIQTVEDRIIRKTGDNQSLREIIARAADDRKFVNSKGQEVVAFGRADLDDFNNWDIYDYGDDMRDEIRTILADPERAASLPDTVKFTKPVEQIKGADGKGIDRLWRKTADHFFSSVYGKKESFLNRSPVFRQYYYRRVEDLLDSVNRDGAGRIAFAVREAYERVPKEQLASLKRLRNNKETVRKLKALKPDKNGKYLVDGKRVSQERYRNMLGQAQRDARQGAYVWNGKSLTALEYKAKVRAAEAAVKKLDPAKIDDWAANYVGSKRLWNKIKNRAKNGPIGGPDLLDKDKLDMLAKGFAMEETKRVFYNASQTNNFADILRIAVPFGPAWNESMKLWRKQVLTNPNRIKNLSVSVQGFRDMDPDGDGKGFVTTDPVTGEQVFNYPFAEDMLPFITGLAGGLISETFLGRGGKGGKAFGVGALGGAALGYFGKERVEERLGSVKPFLQAPVKSLSMNLQVVPGLGPIVQMAAGQALQNKPQFDDVLQIVSPYGPPSGVGALAPSWARKIAEAITANPESDRLYADLMIDAYRAMYATGEYDTNNPESLQLLRERAEDVARYLLVFRGLSQFTGPSRPAVGFDIPVEYGGVQLTDSEAADFAKQGFVPNNLLDNEFRRMQEEDYGNAVVQFLRTFGTDTMLYVKGRTETVGEGLDASAIFGDWERDNERIVEKYPTVFGYFAPTGSEFDLQTYLRQIATGKRERITDPMELQRDAEAVVGKALYMQAARQFPQNPNDIDEENLREYRTELEKRLPGFRYQVIELGERELLIGQLLDEQAGPSGQPMGAAFDPDLDGNPVAEALRVYGKYRRQAIDEAVIRAGGIETSGLLSRTANSDLRQWLRNIGTRITNRYPEFERVWSRLLFDEVDI